MKSKLFSLSGNDWLKAFGIAVGTGVLTTALELAQTGELFKKSSLHLILTSAIAAAVAYLGKQLTTNSDGKLLKKEDNSNYVGGKKS